MTGRWVPHETRDEVIDFIHEWSRKTELTAKILVLWIGITYSKYFEWKKRYGKVNEHNAWIPRDHWLEAWEREAIIAFYHEHPKEGYRRLTYMMLDQDVVAVSASSVWRVLMRAGLLLRWARGPSGKGTGFIQPEGPHQHWHIDIMCVNIAGTLFFLTSILDGYSRAIIHWEIRTSMTAKDVETIVQRAREKYPTVTPRIISDNGPQFIARDFQAYIRLMGMTHVRTSPYYPESNGKLERYQRTLRSECLRPGTPISLEDAQRMIDRFVHHYNNVRLHSAIGYIAPMDKLNGREKEIFEERDRKLQLARDRRAQARERQRANIPTIV